MKLFRAITLMLGVLTTVPITIVGLILIRSNLEVLKTLTWELQQERTDSASRALSTQIESLISDVGLLVSNLNLENLNLRERQDLLAFLLRKRPELNIIAFYGKDGRPSPQLLAFDPNRILPSELAQHQERVMDLNLTERSGESVLFSTGYAVHRAAQPSFGWTARDEHVIPMALLVHSRDFLSLGMEISLDSMETQLRALQAGKRSQFYVFDSQKILVAKGNPRLSVSEEHALVQVIGQLLPGMPLPAAGAEPADKTPRVSGVRPVKLGEQEHLDAFAPLQRPAWTVLSLEPLDEAYAVTHRMAWQVVLVVLSSLALAIGLGMLFAFGLTRPIARCVTGALAIARGRFGYTLEVTVRNEIGELTHTFNYMSRQLLSYDQENRKLLGSLERGYLETIRALANSIDAKDPYTRGHSDRVTQVALALGRELKLVTEELRILSYGAILHDIGKIGIPEDILRKKEALTTEERLQIEQHPILGERIIGPIDFLQPVRPLIRSHHERCDGRGYPDGLRGDDIPLMARILNAADTYDAVTSNRPYQSAVDDHQAIEIIRRFKGFQVDPLVCDALVVVIERHIDEGELPEIEWPQTVYRIPSL